MARITKDSIQFGEGNFLRAFVDYCIQILNTDTPFDGKVSIVQPLPNGTLSELKRQKGNTTYSKREYWTVKHKEIAFKLIVLIK